MKINLKNRDFLKLLDYTPEEINYLIDLALKLKKEKKAGVSQRVLDNEPLIALYAEEDGLAIYRKIFSQSKNIKHLFFEISPDLVDGLEKLKEEYLVNYQSTYIKDINNFIRFAIYHKID